MGWTAKSERRCGCGCRVMFLPSGPRSVLRPECKARLAAVKGAARSSQKGAVSRSSGTRRRSAAPRTTAVLASPLADEPEELSDEELTRPAWLIETFGRWSSDALWERALNPELPGTAGLAREELARRGFAA